MGKNSDAPSYATAKSDSGLWGSSVTNGSGTTFSPTSWQKDLMSTVGSNINNTLNEYLNPSYDSEDYKALYNDFQKQATDTYDNAVLGTVASRGLMRSSGLNSLTNSFNEDLADQQSDLLQTYKQNKLSDLSTLLGLSSDLYNYSQGENKMSSNLANAISNYNLQKYQLEQANSSGGLSGLLKGAISGASTGSSLGGWGALGGALAGGTAGYFS